jgi:hypothetical protein
VAVDDLHIYKDYQIRKSSFGILFHRQKEKKSSRSIYMESLIMQKYYEVTFTATCAWGISNSILKSATWIVFLSEFGIRQGQIMNTLTQQKEETRCARKFSTTTGSTFSRKMF